MSFPVFKRLKYRDSANFSGREKWGIKEEKNEWCGRNRMEVQHRKQASVFILLIPI